MALLVNSSERDDRNEKSNVTMASWTLPARLVKISDIEVGRGAAGSNFLVATAFSMELMLAAASCRKLHARIQDDTAAASRHTIKVALSESL